MTVDVPLTDAQRQRLRAVKLTDAQRKALDVLVQAADDENNYKHFNNGSAHRTTQTYVTRANPQYPSYGVNGRALASLVEKGLATEGWRPKITDEGRKVAAEQAKKADAKLETDVERAIASILQAAR